MLFTGGRDDKYIYSMDLETLAINKSIQKEGKNYYAYSSVIINNTLIIGAFPPSLSILSLPDLKETQNIQMERGVFKLLVVKSNIIICG